MNDSWVPWTTNMVDDELVKVMLEKAKMKEYKKGEIIFRQGEISNNYFLLMKGRVEVSLINNDGKKKIIGIHEPRYFIGETIQDNCPRLTSAKSLTNVTVALLDSSFDPGTDYLRNKYLSVLYLCTNHKLRCIIQQLNDHVFDEVEDRVEKFLYGLGSNFGEENDDSQVHVNLPVTHQLIADVVGSSRVRVSQVMSQFSKDDKIKVTKNHIVFKKRANKIDR